VFTLHPCFSLAQRSYIHDNKIYAKTTWVIFDCHIEMLVAIEYAINSSITKGLGIYRGQIGRRIEQFIDIPIVGVLLH
jgi:hypothetical protein